MAVSKLYEATLFNQLEKFFIAGTSQRCINGSIRIKIKRRISQELSSSGNRYEFDSDDDSG